MAPSDSRRTTPVWFLLNELSFLDIRNTKRFLFSVLRLAWIFHGSGNLMGKASGAKLTICSAEPLLTKAMGLPDPPEG